MQIFFVALRLYFGSWSPLTGFAITLTLHTTLRRTPLDEWSARRRNLYLTTHNAHKRQTSMPPPVFEPTIPTGEWPQTHTLGQTATAIGEYLLVQSDCTRNTSFNTSFCCVCHKSIQQHPSESGRYSSSKHNPEFCGTRMLITMFTRVHHMSLFGNKLTLIVLMWRIGWAHNNARK